MIDFDRRSKFFPFVFSNFEFPLSLKPCDKGFVAVPHARP